ncbi:MAG: PQQ-binding-like beta-propeller repeat protein [Planctomycetales bacterium]|nr:PQQ-binding-like beta-propeller repeat protein [Planctomycetales bacterium]
MRKFLILALSIFPGYAYSQNSNDSCWPQWRGPTASGAADAELPLSFDSQNQLWSIRLPGLSHSTPIVCGDLLVLLSANETDQAVSEAEYQQNLAKNQHQKTQPPEKLIQIDVMAVERKTGQIRWVNSLGPFVSHEGKHPTNSFASTSPVSQGKRIFIHLGSRGIYCLSWDGETIWKRDLGHMATRYGWGEGTSPAVTESLLIVQWDHEGDSFVTALRQSDGSTAWTSVRDEPTSWSTPLVVRHHESERIICAGTNGVSCYDANTGKLIWKSQPLTTNVVASPVADATTVYAASSYGESRVLAIPIDSQGEVTEQDERWRYEKAGPYVPSPLLYQDRLYLLHGNNPILTVLDTQTGQPVLKATRLPGMSGPIYASPVAADGKFIVASRSGDVAVYDADVTSGLRLLAKTNLEQEINASPVIVDSQLFLRTVDALHCFATGI